MGVFISDDELNTFKQNGVSDDQIQDTITQYRGEGVSDDEIRSKIDTKLVGFRHPVVTVSQPKKAPEIEPPSDGSTKVLTGGVEQKYTQNWDKNGKVYLTDENGNRVKNNNDLNWFQKQGRKAKSWTSNFGDYVNANNGDIYNKKVGDVVSALSLFIPAFKAVPAINNPIAKGAANWAANGAVGGAVEGVAENMREDKAFYNPANIAKEAGVGAVLSGGLGAGVAKAQVMKGVLNRVNAINARKSTPLYERFNPKFDEVIQPSQFGVNKIDSELNQNIAKQMESNINTENGLFKEYKILHSKAVKKYGSIENLKQKAISDMKEHTKYGVQSSAIDDYRELVEYEKTLQNARYINNNIKSSVTREKLGKNNAKIQEIMPEKEAIEPLMQDQAVYIEEKIPAFVTKSKNNARFGAEIPEVVQTIPFTGETKRTRLSQTAELPKDLKEGINEIAPEYMVLHNKDLMAKAQKLVNDNPDALRSDLLSRAGKNETNLEALDFENARHLVSKLYKEGKLDEALDLTDLISQKGSKAGQAVQSMSLWGKTTPEGAVRQAQRLIAQYNKSSKKQLPKLTTEQAQEVMELAMDIHKQTDDRARDVATAKLLKYQSDLIPVNGWQKAKTLRNISLLLNPKTLGRNIVGNGIFNSVDSLSKNFAAGIDGIVSKFTGKSTRAFTPVESTNSAISGAIKGAKEGFQDAKLGIDTRGGIGGRFDLPSQRSFKDPVLGGLETALDVGLRVPDRAFYQGVFEESVINQLKAQGLKEATPEIIERANKEALEGVFQNDSAMSQAVLGARKSLNKVTNWISPNSKTFGLGDMVIPYAQTPANIVQQGINYSPAGLMKAVINGVKGDQRQATLDAARGIIGTGVMGAGYAGAKNGVLNGDYEDYNVRKNLETINDRPFQVNLPNDVGVSYSQLQPVSIPLSAGTALAQDDKEKALQSAIGTITELPMLDSMGKLVRDSQNYGIGTGLTNLMMNVPSQFVPTALNQVNAYVDPIQRETYDPNPVMRGLKQGLNKVPLVSKTLPKKYNVKGEETLKYQSEGVNKAFDVFINPVFVNKKKDDLVMKEVQTLYDTTGEKGSLLYIPERKIKIGGETKELSGKEYSEYSKVLGELTYKKYQQLMNTPRYQNADDESRLKLLGKVKENSKAIAQEELFNKINKNSPKNAIHRKINNRINKGQNKIDRIMNKMDNQLIDNIMYEEE